MDNGHDMRNLKKIFFIGLSLAAIIWFTGADPAAGPTLSRKIAPDVPVETFEALVARAKVYLTGAKGKEVLLVADPFCPNSRKAYRLLQNRLEYIHTLKVLLVCRYPERGSDVASAAVMRMYSAGKGETALNTAFKVDPPQGSNRNVARQQALERLKTAFPDELGGDDLETLRPEIDVVSRNTALARKLGYTGTPHIIIGRRVLHGYTQQGIDILLKQDL